MRFRIQGAYADWLITKGGNRAGLTVAAFLYLASAYPTMGQSLTREKDNLPQ
jgi:hypothetical protein